jgi:hypothetical protein
MSLPFDAYTLRARVAPFALAAAPAIALGLSALASIEEAGSILAFVFAAALTVVCGVVRDLGRRLEPGLWESWGGAPTTRMLRWSGNSDSVAQQRRHALLAKVLGEPLPSAAEEESDPAAADQHYEVATAALRQRTRQGPEFKLLADQNAEYGLRRNCLGLRPLALVVAGAVFFSSLLLFFLQNWAWNFALPMGTGLVALVVWWRFVTPGWARVAADLYATRLMETVESLAVPDENAE